MAKSVLVPNPKDEAERVRVPQRECSETGTVRSSPPRLAFAKLTAVEGNRSEQEVLASIVIQPKLIIGAPDDEYEKEADAVAEQMLSFRD
jgi:hypothetical protein